MECARARELADALSGHPLGVQTSQDVSRHFEGCPSCRSELQSLQRLRASLKAAFERDGSLRVRPEFVSRVSTTLRARVVAQRKPARWRWLPAAILATAAMCVLAIGVGTPNLVSARRFTALAREAVGDHENCALAFRLDERPISLAEAGQRFGPFFSALQRLTPIAGEPHEAPVTVLERHACVFNGRRFAHVVVRYRGVLGSILVTRSPDVRLRSSAVMHLDGLWLVSFPASDHAVFVVCPSEVESRELADAFEQPITQALAGF